MNAYQRFQNVVFDWDLIYTGFQEYGETVAYEEIEMQCLTENWFKKDLVLYGRFRDILSTGLDWQPNQRGCYESGRFWEVV